MNYLLPEVSLTGFRKQQKTDFGDSNGPKKKKKCPTTFFMFGQSGLFHSFAADVQLQISVLVSY